LLGAGGVVLSERCPHQGSNLGPGDSQWDGGSGQLDRAVRPPRWSRIRYEALVHWRALTWTFETYGPRCNADPQAHKPQADIPERCPPPDNELRDLRIPRPRSIKGNRLPPTQKSFASAVRVIGTLPSSVRWRTPSIAAARTTSSSMGIPTWPLCSEDAFSLSRSHLIGANTWATGGTGHRFHGYRRSVRHVHTT
jgi:hypothetical protein